MSYMNNVRLFHTDQIVGYLSYGCVSYCVMNVIGKLFVLDGQYRYPVIKKFFA